MIKENALKKGVVADGAEAFDVIIMGGGMVGAALALALAQSFLTIAVVDRQSLVPDALNDGSHYSPRVSTLTEASVTLFKKLNVWNLMVQQRVSPYKNMVVWDGNGTGCISFSSDEVGHSRLGHIVENSVIRNALLELLSATGVTLFGGQSSISFDLDGDRHRVALPERTLSARLLVAAEGAESPLRKAAGIAIYQKDCLHHAVVTTVETEQSHRETAWQVFLDSGPLAFLPLPDRGGHHYCSVVWSMLPDMANEVLALDDASFCQRIGAAFEHRLGRVRSADARFRFPLTQRHAQKYHRNRVVLAGDSAHIIHPLAGQGVNLGFQDVGVLAEEILQAARRGGDCFSEAVLNRYERRRRGHNLMMLKSMEMFQNLFAADDLRTRWLRNTGMNLTSQLPFVKTFLMRQAMGTAQKHEHILSSQTASKAVK